MKKKNFNLFYNVLLNKKSFVYFTLILLVEAS